MTTTNDTRWVRAGTIRPGDRIKVPGGSRRVFRSREDAESWDAPFRTVKRVEPGQLFADGSKAGSEPGWISVWFRDGSFGSYPADAFVLREG